MTNYMIARMVPARCAPAQTFEYWRWRKDDMVLEVICKAPLELASRHYDDVHALNLDYVEVIGSFHPLPWQRPCAYWFGYELIERLHDAMGNIPGEYMDDIPLIRNFGRYFVIKQ